MRRIVDAAVALAEQGGFEAVRLRDVAQRSDVALGTLYKYFRSKEDLLLFAFAEELARLEDVMVRRPVRGATARERVAEFFRRTTRALVRRPPLARALIRSLTGSDRELALQVAAFQLRVAGLVAVALRGEAPVPGASFDGDASRARERAIAFTLMNVWFSALVGWSAGLHGERVVVEQVRAAADLVFGDES